MTQLASTIRENSATIVHLYGRIGETFRYRDRSNKDRDEWTKACADFHKSYPHLCFPGGFSHWEAFLKRSPEEMNAAVTFLEVDPWFFRSGYTKQIIWSRLKKASLTEELKNRIETVAFAYLKKRVCIEFWYMARFVRACGSKNFWTKVEILGGEHESEASLKAMWLLLARRNFPVQNWISRELLRARYESGYVPNFRFTK